MGVLFSRQRRDAQLGSWVLPSRMGNVRGSASITSDTALRQSAVWAAIRLRADLISTLPVDVFRRVGGAQVEVPKPPVLVSPTGDGMTLREWLYSTQVDLDRVGNSFGLITARDGAGHPARIELVVHSDVTVLVNKQTGVVRYRVRGVEYDRSQVWHEKQFTVAGLAVGLSPIAYAAWSLGIYQSAQQFALEWFANGGTIPSGHLRNVKKTLDPGEADTVKSRFKIAVEGRDVFVTGADWEYSTIDTAQADSKFLESQQVSDVAAVRYFGVPGDLVDVVVGGSTITYASITQRNLQFLVMNLNPALVRREDALSSLVASPRFVKFNRGAILQMDPETQSKVLIAEIAGFLTAPSEARALMDRAPFTPEQLAEFEVLSKFQKPSTIGAKP